MPFNPIHIDEALLKPFELHTDVIDVNIIEDPTYHAATEWLGQQCIENRPPVVSSHPGFCALHLPLNEL